MKSTASIEGHPIHPMLIVFPFAYLFGSACLDVWARATDRPRWFRTATDMGALGMLTAVAAAVPGLVDYVFAVPPKSSAKDRATNHLFANLSALGLFALARAGRAGDDRRPSRWAVAAEVCGAGLLAAGGWLGGTLVSRNQISVDHRYAGAGRWKERAVVPHGGETIDVGAEHDLKVDQMKLLRIGSRRIVLGRTDRGYVAFEDRCTHKGGSLADGALICGTVQCPWHGSQFDVATGGVKQGPADEAIATYPVAVRGGRLWLHVGAESAGD